MKKIGIIGSGVVAKALGTGFIKHGYEVMLSSRDTSKLNEWKTQQGDAAHTGSFEEAAVFGDIIVLSVAGRAAIEAIEMAGVQHMSGKTIIDTTNPIAPGPPEDGVLKFFTADNDSLMEQLQDRFPDLHFVKAFNSVGSALMVDPQFKEGKPTMFICGNNAQAKTEVKQILDQFGWEIQDMGKAIAARAIEALCIIWCIPGFLENSWGHAFKLLRS